DVKRNVISTPGPACPPPLPHTPMRGEQTGARRPHEGSVLHLLVAQSKVVPDLVDHRLADLLDRLRVGPADRLDVLLVDHDDLGKLPRSHGGLLQLARPLVEPENVAAQFPRYVAGRAGLD